MAKNTLTTFKNLLGYNGKKVNEEKALEVLNEIGVSAIDVTGDTPLIIAAYLERVNILKILIERVDDIDYRVPGAIVEESALLRACDQRRLESIKLLVEAGANLEQTDRFNLTPLSKIFTNTFSDPLPAAKYLIGRGAEITEKVINMGMSWNRERFSEFLKTMDYGFDAESFPENEESLENEKETFENNIDIKHLHTIVNSEDYFETSKIMWQKLVPRSGQATTVQGELIRAIEKLRDEAQRNGNANFNKNCHLILVNYLKTYLTDKNIFNEIEIAETNNNLNLLSREKNPYLDDDVYDNITTKIVDWSVKTLELVPHNYNDKLNC